MSSGYGRSGGGGNATTNNNRKRNKKYGLNLYQLQKGGPAAPPVPSIITSAPSTKNSNPSNGLLLLSKKTSGGGGLLAGKEIAANDGGKQTANDELFAKAQGGATNRQGDRTDEGRPKAPIAAWGNKGEKQQPKQQSVDLSLEELSLKSPSASNTPKVEEPALKYDEKTSLLVLAPKGSLPKQKSSAPGANEAASSENKDQKNSAIADESQQNDEQQQYMSKLAKERAQKVKSEEEARVTQQKERAAKRLKELEAKRLEAKKEKERHQKMKKKQQQHRFDGPPTSIIIGTDAPKKPPLAIAANVPSKIFSRKEVSQPSIVLEPLGKAKQAPSDNPPIDKDSIEAKNEGKKKLYDPNRPYSSLVGGKPKAKPEAVSGGSIKSGKSEESSAAKSKSSGKQNLAIKPTAKREESSAIKMVTLSSFEDRERGAGRVAAGGAGPRMLFDPTSGSLVAAPSGEVQQQQQLSPIGGGKGSLKKANMPKQPFPKPPIGAVKVSDTKQKQLMHQKKSDPKTRNPKKSKAKSPRTRGVQYKKDERGNYVNADECEPDCGYGQHSVPGGRAKNQVQPEKPSKKLNADAPAFFGFQIQKDSTFLQQQTDFEAQQQRILEDAWASLEEAAPSREDEYNERAEVHQPQPRKNVRSQEDEYAAALAISPTMIGLGLNKEEPFDLSKFALEGDSTGLPSNRFSSTGGGGSRLLGSSTWGTSVGDKKGATLGGIAGLTGWNFDPNATDFTPANADTATSNTGNAEQSITNSSFINLNGWGSSGGFGSFAFGGNYKDSTDTS
jgi:hypothetical protein